MTIKDRAVRIITGLPDDVTLGEIVAELRARLRIETGLNQLDDGQGIDHSQVKNRLKKWIA